MNYLQAVVIGLMQGIFELFPLSSLGHTVLVPSWIGGSWATLVRQESLTESPYLAFVVGLHLANAVALVLFFLREWARLIYGFFASAVRRRIDNDTERLAWLIVVATVPVGILGLVFEHEFRVLFAKPLAAAVFLMCNGCILFAGELYRRHHHQRAAVQTGGTSTGPAPATSAPATSASATSAPATSASATSAPATSTLGASALGASAGARRTGGPGLRGTTRFRDEHIMTIDEPAEHQLAGIGFVSALCIGASQALALLAGISREGVAMVGGLFRGLSNENAMRFAFLLSTPVIFAAGALKVPDLLGHLGNGIRGQVLAASAAAVVMSLVALAFLTRYFKTRTLTPFAVYSLLFGLASVVRFGLF